MNTKKDLGIWMDHSTAHLLEPANETPASNVISCTFTSTERHRTGSKGEYMMHNDEQQKQHAYYDKLGDVIKNYDRVVLFGPTSAKEELFNRIKKDRAFEKIKIEIKHADKMTDNQQHAFVKNYFKHVLA